MIHYDFDELCDSVNRGLSAGQIFCGLKPINDDSLRDEQLDRELEVAPATSARCAEGTQ